MDKNEAVKIVLDTLLDRDVDIWLTEENAKLLLQAVCLLDPSRTVKIAPDDGWKDGNNRSPWYIEQE